MPTTPKRAGREPAPGSRFIGEAVAANIRGWRLNRRHTQEYIAEGMQQMGHRWARATVSEVERGGRNITVDEFLSLALILDVAILDLLDPAGDDGTDRRDIDLGVGQAPVTSVQRWLAGDKRLRVRPQDKENR